MNKSNQEPGVFRIDSLSALLEYAKFKPESLIRIRCKPTLVAEVEQRIRQICGGVRIPVVSQNQALRVDGDIKLSTENENNFLRKSQLPNCILATDHITDPRNLGAIVRSAAFFGWPYILTPKNRQVLLNNAAVSTAQGGFALTQIVEVVNLSRCLVKLKKMGYWVLGADVDGSPVEDVRQFYDRIVVVVGSEGCGLSAGVKKHCDRIITIPSSPRAVESLNVAVAAGILMSRLGQV